MLTSADLSDIVSSCFVVVCRLPVRNHAHELAAPSNIGSFCCTALGPFAIMLKNLRRGRMRFHFLVEERGRAAFINANRFHLIIVTLKGNPYMLVVK